MANPEYCVHILSDVIYILFIYMSIYTERNLVVQVILRQSQSNPK